VDVRRAVWVVVVLFVAGLGVAGPVVMVTENLPGARPGAPPPGSAATGATVHMAGLTFAPATLAVARGTEVLFDNDDVAPHTVTADSGGGVDSGTLNPGSSFRLVVNEPLSYHCDIHPSMKARIQLSG
jgi:plastocyanin